MAFKPEDRLMWYATLFSTETGKKVLDDLRRTLARPSYEPGMKDPERETYYREGQRSILLGIEAAMAAGFTLMDATLDDTKGPQQVAILEENEE